MWFILIPVVIVLALAAGLFYRHAQNVQSDWEGEPGGAPPPMFAGVQRRIRRTTR